MRKFSPLTLIFIFSLLFFTAAVQAQNPWLEAGFNYRVQVKVEPEGSERKDKPVELDLNFTQLLAGFHDGLALNSSSIRILEVDKTGQALSQKVPFQFDRDANYDSENNAKGKLIFLLKGVTRATRFFQIYFDTDNAIRSAIVSSQLAITDQVQYEGQESFKIIANNATYIYHKQGAGFASIVDQDSNDWIGYHAGGKSAGELRGLPNLGEFARPGLTNSRSTILHRGPLKISILSETLDGKSAVQWDFFPAYARMTLLRSAAPYSFMYEGTPAGKLDLETTFMVNSEGRKTYARQDWNWDLPKPEWLYFGDEKIRRAFFLAHHEDDDKPDQFWQMDGNMTVFGFGRQYRCCNRYLTQAPAHFTLGLVEESNFSAVSNVINSAMQDVASRVGKAELRFENLATKDITRPRITNTVKVTAKPKPEVSVINSISGVVEPVYKNKPEHQFFGGYCTWYAARKFKEFTGAPVTWSGDGGAWFDHAAAEGRRVTTDPKEVVKGSVMVWTRGGYGKGHVAFVEDVDENGIYLSEMNVRGRWVVSNSVIPYSNLNKGTKYKFKGFILPE